VARTITDVSSNGIVTHGECIETNICHRAGYGDKRSVVVITSKKIFFFKFSQHKSLYWSFSMQEFFCEIDRFFALQIFFLVQFVTICIFSEKHDSQ